MLEKNTRWAVIGAAILFVISGLQTGVIARRDMPRALTFAGSPLTLR